MYHFTIQQKKPSAVIVGQVLLSHLLFNIKKHITHFHLLCNLYLLLSHMYHLTIQQYKTTHCNRQVSFPFVFCIFSLTEKAICIYCQTGIDVSFTVPHQKAHQSLPFPYNLFFIVTKGTGVLYSNQRK